MIPPCDPSILEQNPQFKRLYENLTTNVLDYDGSTRAHKADPGREAVVEDLKRCQARGAKKKIKQRTLKQLAFASDTALPDECHDNLAIISIYLDTPCAAIELDIPQPDSPDQGQDGALSLLAPEFESFYSHIPAFILHFSNLLSTTIQDLRTLATISPDGGEEDSGDSTGASGLERGISGPSRTAQNHNSRARARDRRVRTSMAPVPPLSPQLQDRVRTIRRVQLSELPAARRQMAATAAAVVRTQGQILERTVVILERVKHGALARATKAKAEHLATVAQGIEGKLEVTKLEIAATLYTPETLAALRRYQQHLRDTREQLNDRRASAIEELKRYGDVNVSETSTDRTGTDGGTLAEIARRYGTLARDVENVRVEIARLGE